MTQLSFYFRYALRSLWRGGQRTLLAILCIAFGVMSLISLLAVADMVLSALVPDPRLLTGGDAMLARFDPPVLANGDADNKPNPLREQFSQANVDQLAQLRRQGLITSYTLTTDRLIGLIKPEHASHSTFVTRVMGVDPGTYPLVGDFALTGQTGENHSALEAALRQPFSAAITRDLAEAAQLQTGDQFSLVRYPGLPIYSFRVSAIIQTMPDRRGSTILYSLATAQKVEGWPDAVNLAFLLRGPKGDPLPTLRAAGWSIYSSQDMTTRQRNDNVTLVFTFMLRAAGILGLILGGIGVANTIRVQLARRTLEIATLKTSGYRQRDLLALFSLEIGLLGLLGSLLGALVAFGVSSFLIGLVQIFLTDVGSWSIRPVYLVGGTLSGVVTSVMLSLGTILTASAVRPAVLLRGWPAVADRVTGRVMMRIYVMFGLFFAGLSSLVMQSLAMGAAVVVGSLAGLVLLGLVFAGLFALLLRVPLPSRSMLHLARNGLRRQRTRSLFAFIALFCGVFTIGFASTAIKSAIERAISNQHIFTGSNLWVYTSTEASDATVLWLARQGARSISTEVYLPVQIHLNGEPLDSVLDGRGVDNYKDAYELLNGAVWDTAADAAYLPEGFGLPPANLKVGSRLEVATQTGQVHSLRVVGFYKKAANNKLQLTVSQSLLVNAASVRQLGGPAAMAVVNGTFPADRLSAVTGTINQDLPGSMVFSNGDVSAVLDRRYWELVNLVYGIAGLSLVAGAVLIADSTSLGMIERRRELGILKAVGFSSGKVLEMILLENGLLGLLAGGMGMAAVAATIPILNKVQPSLRMGLHMDLVVIMIFIALAFSTGSAALVAWRPVHDRPMEVLRSE